MEIGEGFGAERMGGGVLLAGGWYGDANVYRGGYDVVVRVGVVA